MSRQYWWVSQGKNYKHAIPQGTLWTTYRKDGLLHDRSLIKDMQPGDVVIHYADLHVRAASVVTESWVSAPRPDKYPPSYPGDSDDGWLVRVDVFADDLRLHFGDIPPAVPAGPPGPLDKNREPKQLYLAALTEEDARLLLEAAGASLPVEEAVLGLPESHWDEQETTSEAFTRIRLEQGHLRKHLLTSRATAPCALCGRTLPAALLVAAHITPRRSLTDSERWDFASAAMLTCTLGCDALFEWGYVVVDDQGRIIRGRDPETTALRDLVDGLVGRFCTAHNSATRARFASHRESHPTTA